MHRMLKEKLKSENVVIAILVLLIVVVTAVYFFLNKGDEIVVEKSKNNTVTTQQASSSAVEANENTEIKVYVVGAVNKPGVVILKKGQIIEDAVKLAGGFKEDADIESINLVYKLNENVMLKIKTKKEQSIAQSNIQNSKDAKNESENASIKPSGCEIVLDSNGAIENQGSTSSSKFVNINSASQEQLMELPGIGKGYAEKIIQYREKTGRFKTKEDIKKVSGIGNAKYNSIKDMIIAN